MKWGELKQIILAVMVLFLVVNIGVLYYMVLFGDFAEFNRRVDLVERRLNSLVRRDDPDLPEVKTTSEIISLTEQQKTELAQIAVGKVEGQINKIVTRQVADQLEENEAADDTSAPVKEFFVALGRVSATTSDFNWVDTPSQVEIDLSNYGQVKSVEFEATLRVPTGNGQVEVRLINATDNVPVAGSELMGDGIGGVYKKSGKLTLTAGKKVYKVQMRTSQNFEGVMENGRIKIVVG